LLVYKVGGTAVLPEPVSYTPPALNPPAVFGDDALLAKGEQHYNEHCGSCHGNSGRVSSLFPDLKVAAALNSAELFKAIVVDGILQNNGMVSFASVLTPDDAESIRAYVVKLSNDAKNAPPQAGPGGPPPAAAAQVAPAPAPAVQVAIPAPAPAAPAQPEVHQ
jgi:mono/diheme cytochrome c family protein